MRSFLGTVNRLIDNPFMTTDYTQFNSATIALLAVPGLDNLGRLFTGLAASCAVASTIIGVALLWHYEGTSEEDGTMNVSFLESRDHCN
jgi:hypothetical protein